MKSVPEDSSRVESELPRFDRNEATKLVFAHPTLSPAARLVWLAIANRWSVSSPRPFPGTATLVRETKLAKPTAVRATRELEAKRVLAIEQDPKHSQRHRYNLEPVHQLNRSNPDTGSEETPVSGSNGEPVHQLNRSKSRTKTGSVDFTNQHQSGSISSEEIHGITPSKRSPAAADPKDLSGSGAPETTAKAATAATARLANLGEALKLPIEERSKLLREDASMAPWVRPHEWPEIGEVASALAASSGDRTLARLSSYNADAGVRAVVELFASGYTLKELVDVAENLPKTGYWTQASRGLSSLSPEVVRRAIRGEPQTRPRPLRGVAPPRQPNRGVDASQEARRL